MQTANSHYRKDARPLPPWPRKAFKNITIAFPRLRFAKKTAKLVGSLGHPSVFNETAVYGDNLRGNVRGTSHAEKCHQSAHFVRVGPSTHGSPLLDCLNPGLQGSARDRGSESIPPPKMIRYSSWGLIIDD